MAVTIVTALVVAAYIYTQLDDEIRRHVLHHISQHYPELDVRIASARLVEGRGLEIRQLTIAERGRPMPWSELLRIEEIVVVCNTDLRSILQNRFDVRCVIVRRPVLRVSRRPDATWTVSQLLPLPTFKRGAPQTIIEHGAICWYSARSASDAASEPMALRDVNLKLTPQPAPAGGEGARRNVSIQGTFGGDHVQRGEVSGSLDIDCGHGQFTAMAQHVALGRDLADALPESLAKLWYKFQPEGDVRVQVQFNYDGHEWSPVVDVALERVGFIYDKFPYPLERGRGSVAWREKVARFELVAYSGDQPVSIRGMLVDPGPQQTGWVRVTGRDIAIDEKLILALPGRCGEVVHQLRPTGRVHIDWNYQRQDRSAGSLKQQLVAEVLDGSIRHEKFPYPVGQVRGVVTWSGDRWELRDFHGINDGGELSASGHVVPTLPGYDLMLTVHGRSVPLDAELHAALAPRAQHWWRALNPRGDVHFEATVRAVGGVEPEIQVAIQPIMKSTFIEPANFPVRMDLVRGVFRQAKGRVEFEDVLVQHDDTMFVGQGSLSGSLDGSWQLDFSKLRVDLIQLDHDLLAALPIELQNTARRLNPQGPLSMNGSLHVEQGLRGSGPVSSRWDLRLDLHETDIDCGVRLGKVRGAVRLYGACEGAHLGTYGDLAIDSLNVRNLRVTDIRGTLFADEKRVLLGASAGREHPQHAATLTAKLYGGTLGLDGWLVQAEQHPFALQATLREADLAHFAQEVIPGQQRLKGKLHADLLLQGTSHPIGNLDGHGTVRLREADIYELPIVLQLLSVLNARLPNPTAFTQSDMKFDVNSDHVLFEQLDLLGNAVNLYGQGTLDFEKRLNLAFHTNFRKSDLPLPIVRNLLGEASQQILQIYAQGPFDNPEISTKPFPVMNQALQQLQDDLETSRTRESRLWKDWFDWFPRTQR